jgi:hypothetical protein
MAFMYTRNCVGKRPSLRLSPSSCNFLKNALGGKDHGLRAWNINIGLNALGRLSPSLAIYNSWIHFRLAPLLTKSNRSVLVKSVCVVLLNLFV